MNKYGPTRGEHKIRLAICIFGLGLTAFAVSFHGIRGIASLEIILISGAVFGGTGFFSLRALLKGDAE
ncbi:MAG: hypothetical protein KJP02_00535 [Octadecabacter sp.]|nr:hypothetical protein [Octadecabacter sp.]